MAREKQDGSLATMLMTTARIRAMEVARELQTAREKMERADTAAAAANAAAAAATKTYLAARETALAIGVWTEQELIAAGARKVPSPRTKTASTPDPHDTAHPAADQQP